MYRKVTDMTPAEDAAERQFGKHIQANTSLSVTDIVTLETPSAPAIHTMYEHNIRIVFSASSISSPSLSRPALLLLVPNLKNRHMQNTTYD